MTCRRSAGRAVPQAGLSPSQRPRDILHLKCCGIGPASIIRFATAAVPWWTGQDEYAGGDGGGDIRERRQIDGNSYAVERRTCNLQSIVSAAQDAPAPHKPTAKIQNRNRSP